MKNKKLLNIAFALGLMTTATKATFMFGGGDDDSSKVKLSQLFTSKNYSKLPGEKKESSWHFERQTSFVDEKNSSAGNLSVITFGLEIKYGEVTRKRKNNSESNGEDGHQDKKNGVEATNSAATSTSHPKTPIIKVDLRSCLPEVIAHDSPEALFGYFRDALTHKLLGDKFLPSEEDKELLVLYEDLGDFDARKFEPRVDTKDKFQLTPETFIGLKRRGAKHQLEMNRALYTGIRTASSSFSQRFTFPQNTGEITLAIQQSTVSADISDDMQKLSLYPGEFFDALEGWLKSMFDHISFQVEEKTPSGMHS